jgi:hypothetical protein
VPRREDRHEATLTSAVDRGVAVLTEVLGVRNHLTNSISLGRQVFLIQGSSGPYIRRMVNQAFPGTVSSQLLSFIVLS